MTDPRMNPDAIRDGNGNLPAFMPPNNPMFYMTVDGGKLCATCANGPESKQAEADCPDDDQWRVVAYDVNWEDRHLHCDNCEELIAVHTKSEELG